MAALVAHGLSRPRFVPPPETRALRDLTRTRVGRVQPRSQAQQRVQKGREASNLKRARVALGGLWPRWAAEAARPSGRAKALRRRSPLGRSSSGGVRCQNSSELSQGNARSPMEA